MVSITHSTLCNKYKNILLVILLIYSNTYKSLIVYTVKLKVQIEHYNLEEHDQMLKRNSSEISQIYQVDIKWRKCTDIVMRYGIKMNTYTSLSQLVQITNLLPFLYKMQQKPMPSIRQYAKVPRKCIIFFKHHSMRLGTQIHAHVIY